MPKGNWKSLALLGGVVGLGVSFIFFSLYSLRLLDWSSLGGCAVLLVLTLAAGRFTVQVKDGAGVSHSRKSAADAFVFLGAMLYGPALATVLAGIDGFGSSLHKRKVQRLTVFATGAAIASTFIAVFFYRLLIMLLVGRDGTSQGETPFSSLLLPLCVMALVQYFLHTIAMAAFLAFEAGERRPTLSRETLIWTSMAQLACASASALFYFAWQGGGVPFVFIGLLIIALVYLLNRFNEQRVDEIRRAEAEKFRHIGEMAEIHMNTIESLAIAIDAKDQTTHGHVRRTQIYAMELGKLLNVEYAELEALRAGALLHDVGKLAVPEYILNKPSKLTAAEFEKMKIHTVVGGDIIKRVNFPYPVEDIVRFHHEKWDGTGYPKGLRGEDIPLVARIIAVVDFYDATRCDRPYRVGMKREESLELLRKMAGTSFDPRIVQIFQEQIDYFDSLIAEHDIQEQVSSAENPEMTNARPDAGLISDILGAPDDSSGFRSIAEAQREVFALHEIAQTIGSSLNLQDTVTLVSSKLRAIVPFNTCIIWIVDERTGKAVAAHAAGDYAEAFGRRSITIGEGITGWVIANARSMCNTSPELDLVGLPEDVVNHVKGVLVAPLVREDGAFGAITLYSSQHSSYTTEHVRLLESVSQHASSALNNALMFEKTKESALTDPLTELPNARALHLMLEQRIAECQRLSREPLAVLSMDLDDFKRVNNSFGHGIGDRLLAGVAEVMKKQLRQMDVLSRYAGDEFVAVMPMASKEVASMVAERIRKAVEETKFPVRTGRTTQVGVSIGIACFPTDGETSEDLFMTAERNMQRDKHTRRLGPNIVPTGAVSSLDAFR
jgi:diguanylate cyclase (GGDEF)-like protein/putative nucleotidyltransferase with HDIG domain